MLGGLKEGVSKRHLKSFIGQRHQGKLVLTLVLLGRWGYAVA